MEDAGLKDRYQREGYLVFPSVLPPDLVRAASEHVEWLQRQHPDVRPESLHYHLMWDDPFWFRLVSDPRILDLVEAIIGPNIALFATHYICKPGGDGLPVLWHQDGSYWPLEPMDVVSAWLAVDDSTVENGCMRVIPGSHGGPLLDHRQHDQAAVLHTEIDAQPPPPVRAHHPLHPHHHPRDEG
ncbi:MAG: Phytanoyl-CoA dioxygenase [Armatimonadetes bacterium]|nr:Phytanoyl-CoA dioxygenase [Armatimonadota bacterium]